MKTPKAGKLGIKYRKLEDKAFVGYHTVDPAKVSNAEKEWEAWPFDRKHAEKCYQDTVTDQGEIPPGTLVCFGIEFANFNIVEAEEKGLLYTRDGNHRRAAMVMGQERTDYEVFKKWKMCKVLCFPQGRTPEVLEFLRVSGQLRNKAAAHQRKATYTTIEQAMHRDIQLAMKNNGGKIPPGYQAQQLLKWKLTWGISPDMGRTYYQTAKRTGAVRERIEQVLSGACRLNSAGKPKKPTGHYWATHIGGIPDDDLVVFLDRCIEGDTDLKFFSTQCQQFKLEQKVRECILVETALETWAELQAKYPNLAADSFISSWLPAWDAQTKAIRQRNKGASRKSKVKFTPPEGLLSAIATAVNRASVVRTSNSSVRDLSTPIFIFVMFCLQSTLSQ